MQEKGGENAYLRMERSPGFKQQRRLHFAAPLGPLFNVFFLPLVASLSEGEHCRVSTRSDENVTAWFMPHLDPLFFSAGRSRRFFPPRGRRPYPASAEGKVPCKGSKLFYSCRPKPVEHNNAIVFLTPPGPTFQENGRIFRTFWLMICARHGPRWNCLLCFVWGGGELF